MEIVCVRERELGERNVIMLKNVKELLFQSKGVLCFSISYFLSLSFSSSLRGHVLIRKTVFLCAAVAILQHLNLNVVALNEVSRDPLRTTACHKRCVFPDWLASPCWK